MRMHFPPDHPYPLFSSLNHPILLLNQFEKAKERAYILYGKYYMRNILHITGYTNTCACLKGKVAKRIPQSLVFDNPTLPCQKVSAPRPPGRQKTEENLFCMTPSSNIHRIYGIYIRILGYIGIYWDIYWDIQGGYIVIYWGMEERRC